LHDHLTKAGKIFKFELLAVFSRAFKNVRILNPSADAAPSFFTLKFHLQGS